MNKRQLKKLMLRRFKSKKGTFRLEYVKALEKTYIYILDNQLIGSIDMSGDAYLEDRMQQVSRFDGDIREVISTILLGISSLILLKKINPIISESYTFPPEKFFDITKNKTKMEEP